MQRHVSTRKRKGLTALVAHDGRSVALPLRVVMDHALIRPMTRRIGEMSMFDVLDRQTRLTGNQKKIIAAAVIGDALEFFDYFLIGFVLAFLIGPWKLTFGQSAIVLLSSGVGAILGAYIWGWLADRIGRRKVFIGTVLNFSIATGLLYFTPENGWIYITIMRFFVGFGVGGLYCVDLPLVQEFVPARKRGWVGGLVTCVIPLASASARRAGRLHGRRSVAPAVRHRRAAVAARPAGPPLGTGIAGVAGPPGPLRRSPQVARLGASDEAQRPAAAQGAAGRIHPRRAGSNSSSIRAACWFRGSAMPAPRRASPASRSGRRRCSCCC